MPHAPHILPAALARLLLLMLLVPACSRPDSGELHVLVDSTKGDYALEVLAISFDPASIQRLSASANGAPSPPLPPAVAALRDSALEQDAIFQRSRNALNEEAHRLRTADRRSPEYGRRYDTWVRGSKEAEAARAARDRLRSRLAALRGANDSAAALTSIGPSRARAPIAQIAATAKANDGEIVRAPLRNQAAMLSLPAGRWWITLAYGDGTVDMPAKAASIRTTTRDTLRLPHN